MNEVTRAVFECIEGLAPRGVHVAFSGGLDSTALVLACLELDLEFDALHVNHGLQQQAADWERHCNSLCRELGVPFAALRVSVAPGNVEAAARQARYAALADKVGRDELLLLGHHADDHLETVLMRLFQGRGVMTMRPEGAVGEGRFVRPLLQLSKADLEAFVVSKNVAWIEDPSNTDAAYDRNFLRQNIVPRLTQRWPQIGAGVARAAVASEAGRAALEFQLAVQPNVLPLDELPAPELVRVAWLQAYLKSRGHHDVADKALAEFSRQLDSAASCELAIGHALLGGYDGRLWYEAVRPQPLPALEGAGLEADAVDLGWATLKLQPSRRCAMAFPRGSSLTLGYRGGGEKLREHAQGPSRSLKALLSERRVPPWRRAAMPLIFDEYGLLCVPGVATRASEIGAAEWCRAVLEEK